MQSFTDELKEEFRRKGADLVGIAPIDRFADVPADRHPASIMPEARSVIVAAFMIPRGVLRGIEEGTYILNYGAIIGSINGWLPWFFHEVMDVLERKGWEAAPIFPNHPDAVMNQGVKVSPERPAPNVGFDVEQAAVRAGLGEISYQGQFITPEFGPLQKLLAIITDAELMPDSMLEKSICDMCGACRKACPLEAISDKISELTIAGKSTSLAHINYTKCNRCQNGMAQSGIPNIPPDRIPALCGRECLVHLEEKGVLAHKWASGFRKRAPWTVVDDEPADYRLQAESANLG